MMLVRRLRDIILEVGLWATINQFLINSKASEDKSRWYFSLSNDSSEVNNNSIIWFVDVSRKVKIDTYWDAGWTSQIISCKHESRLETLKLIVKEIKNVDG